MKTVFGDHVEHILLFLISCLVIFINYIFYKIEVPHAIILLSCGIAFLTFANIVFSVGHSEAYYHTARIYLKNGEIIKGTILKFGNYVSLLADDKKYLVLINRDDISYIEEIGLTQLN